MPLSGEFEPMAIEKTAADFIRSLPLSLAVDDVAQRLEAKGYDVTRSTIYKVRSQVKAGVLPDREKSETLISFLAKLSPSLPATDMFARAKAAGFDVALNTIYATRTTLKKRRASGLKGYDAWEGRGHSPSDSPAVAQQRVRVAEVKAVHAGFAEYRALVLRIGTTKAREYLDEIEGSSNVDALLNRLELAEN